MMFQNYNIFFTLRRNIWDYFAIFFEGALEVFDWHTRTRVSNKQGIFGKQIITEERPATIQYEIADRKITN